jgi:3-oxoacyl-(acyl-carrier-protein) synthase/NAD(P)-dependent dehydrogenase (short-subunit alcohol dehydrogenase family)
VARQSAEAVAVWLGSSDGQSQAQLAGFKSRALRAEAPTQRHLYLTAWRAIDVAVAQGGTMLVIGDASGECTRISPQASGDERLAEVGGGAWAGIAVAAVTQHAALARRPLAALEVALTLVQAQAAMASPPSLWLLTKSAQAANPPEHAGSWGLARSAREEASMPVQCVDGAVGTAAVPHWTPAEPEVVMHRGGVIVPRLVRAPGLASPATAPAASAQLVTGGTGGLGLLTARWLAQRGATLALASRSGMLARDAVGEWAAVLASNVGTRVLRCDTAEGAHIGWLVARSAGAGCAMGAWHAAGLLADGVLPRQTAEALARVCAPKAHGAWVLHRACTTVLLSACALFSSTAALLGGAGQANYAAANACLDALASRGRARARLTTSVQWGAWAEVGMAARGAAAERMAAMETASGFGRIGLAQGLGALHVAVLPLSPPLVGVMPVQWERMASGGAVPTFLSSMVTPTPVQCACAAPIESLAASVLSLEAVLEMVRRTAGGAVDADAPLMEAGVDSLGAVELRNQLERTIGKSIALSSTLVFDHPTARQVALSILGERASVPAAGHGDAACALGGTDVNVSGVSAVLPFGVSRAHALREASHCGCDLLREIPAARWNAAQAAFDLVGSAPEVASRVRHGAFVHGAELFAKGFFSVSAAEAAAMDPQQRQLLEHGYAALHAAGASKAALLGATVAVNVGQWASEFGSAISGSPASCSVYASTGFSCSVTCGRVSFVLGLHGPCASYDTACSASLVANHGSVRALQRVECASALSAGVNMLLDSVSMRGNAMAGFTSVRGRSHTFDVRADGYARGEAIDAVACRLGSGEEAAPSQAGMKGSAIRQDGRSASLTAPNGQAQQGVLGASLADARLGVSEVAELEAHGTGTALGDPIEAGAVAAVFLARPRGVEEPLRIGSLKANAGHTEPGAGLAGALKLLMQLQSESSSPNAQLRALNPHVAGALRARTACGMPTQVTEKMSHENHVGGVSSFGYAGTIAHAVLARAGGASALLAFGVRDARNAASPLAYRRRAFSWRDAVGTAPTVGMSTGQTRAQLARAIPILDVPPLNADTPLMTAGINSLAGLRFAALLQNVHVGISLTSTLIFEQPTPRAIAEHLVTQHAQGPTATLEGLLGFVQDFIAEVNAKHGEGHAGVFTEEHAQTDRSQDVTNGSTTITRVAALPCHTSMPAGCDFGGTFQLFDPHRAHPSAWQTLVDDIPHVMLRHEAHLDVLTLEDGSVSFFVAAQRVSALVEELHELGDGCMAHDAGIHMTTMMLEDYHCGAFHMLQTYGLEPDDDVQMVARALDRLAALHPMLRSVHVPPAFWIRERASYELDETVVPHYDGSCADALTKLPIDLSKAVFRARLYRVHGQGAAFLGLSVHHLVLDGPSQQVCPSLRWLRGLVNGSPSVYLTLGWLTRPAFVCGRLCTRSSRSCWQQSAAGSSSPCSRTAPQGSFATPSRITWMSCVRSRATDYRRVVLTCCASAARSGLWPWRRFTSTCAMT